MNLQNIFSEIENVDPEVYDKMDTRRSAMKQFANFTGKAALAAMPFALGSMFKKAYGQTTTDVVNTLNFALTLEYLESAFYTQAIANGVATGQSAAAMGALNKIRDHEAGHVQYLKTVIQTITGSPAPASPVFDFTAGNGTGTGPFVGWNTNYDVFLAVAQTFEDTGVRAYKGSAGTLINNKAVLTAALDIHSVEARHASHIRQMRRARAVATGSPVYVTPINPWIVGNQSNIGTSPYMAAVQPNYNGEENTTQGPVNILTLASATGSSTSAAIASASFDEPLTQAQVLTIVDPFIV